MASRLQDVILRGTAASRPTATTVAPGTLYYSTDTAVTERCADTGLTWETYSDGGTAGAPTGASYVTLGTDATLTSERVLTAGTGITLTDAGAGSTVTIAASGGSGGLVLLEQHTASSSASLDFTTCITSTYDRYFVTIHNLMPATNATQVSLRFSTNGGSSYDATGIYTYLHLGWSSGGPGAGGSTTATAILVSSSTNNISTGTPAIAFNGHFYIVDPLSTTYHKQIEGGTGHFLETTVPTRVGSVFSGSYASTTAANAFRILMSSGNIASGIVRVYGVAK